MTTPILNIHSFVQSALKQNSTQPIFDILIANIESYIEGAVAHNMLELRNKANDKKKKGDLFEAFCFLYIKNILHHTNVFMYSDIPDEIKIELSLNTSQDYGIDIVSMDEEGNYYATQCKYRKIKDKIQVVSWKELATFYGIVNKTGPWKNHITMTNVHGCKHIGKKTEKDWSICVGTFRKMNTFQWLQLIGISGSNNTTPTRKKVKLVITNLETSSTKIETSNTKIEISSTKIETSSTKIETSNTKIETPNTKIETSNTKINKSKKLTLRPNLDELRRKRCEFYDKNKND